MVLFSLCIPTMRRFDKFLDQYLEIYLDMKNAGILDEIIVCDENGNDYAKILHRYNNGDPYGPIKIYKNQTKLGAFKNKLKVASLANSKNFVAVIDSDNLVGPDYFEAATMFIHRNQLRITDDVVLCPYKTESQQHSFDYSEFLNIPFDYLKTREYSGFQNFQVLLNTGNYIITKHVYDKLNFTDEEVANAGPYDVIFKHMLAFYQNPRYRVYLVNDMKYMHIVHEQSFYLQTHQQSIDYYYQHIIPQLCHL